MSSGNLKRSASGWKAAALLALLQLALALPYLQTVPRFYNDEAWEASLGHSLAYEGTLRHRFIEGWGGMHVHFVQNQAVLPFICAAIFRVAGVGVITSRLGSVLMSMLAVVCVYGVMRRWFGARLALWIGLATIVHPWFFEISRRVRPEIYYLALAMAALWCLLHAIESRRRWSAVLGGVLAGLAGLAHPTGFLLVLAMAGAVLLWAEGRRNTRALLWSGVGFAVALLPYAVYVLWAIQDPQVDFFVQMRGNKPVVSLDLASLAAGEFRRWSHFFQWPKGAPLCAVAVASWLAGWCRSTRADKSIATTIAIFAIVLPVTTVNLTSRYLVVLTPLLAAMIVRLVDRLVRPRQESVAGIGRYRVAQTAAGLGAAAIYAATSVAAIGLMVYHLRNADLNRVLARVASIVESESRISGPPVLWMGQGRYPYYFVPFPEAEDKHVVFERVRKRRFDYVVRASWCLWSSGGISEPPQSMPPMRTWSVIDQVCSRLGTEVAEFHAPGYGAFEVYRLGEGAVPNRP